MDPNDNARPEERSLHPRRKRLAELREAFLGDPEEELFIDLFDRADIRRKLLPRSAGLGFDDFDLPPDETQYSTEALVEWAKSLKGILTDHRGARRPLLLADDPLLDRLSGVRRQCPGFETVADFVMRAASLSARTQSPLSLPPMLLVGPAGVGKTHFARQLAMGLQVHLEFVCGDLLSDRGTLTGLSPAWRAARMGRIAGALLESETASPLFVVDEVDKVSAIHAHENPLAFLHTVLEPENAKRFTDEYLQFPIRADHAFWILTANSAETLSPSVLDRLLVLPIKPPDRAAMIVIARNIYCEANAQHGNWFESEPDAEILAALVRYSPRRASKIVEFAFGFAAAEQRQRMTVQDVSVSAALLEMYEGARGKMGFVGS